MSVIEVQHLRKTYGSTVAVDDVSFTVEEGEIFGVLGPNGAGKSTTVECLAGLRRPDGGRCRVLGYDPQTEHPAVRQVLGVQLQSGALPDRLTVQEAFDLYAALYPDPADPRQLIDELGLARSTRTRYAALSGGQQQRLAIGLALVGNPRVAILDELTTGLDPQGRRETWELIEQVRQRGVTIVLVSHFMDEAERLCDRLAVIDAGRVVALDTPTGLIGQTAGRQEVRVRLSAAPPPAVSAELQAQGVTVDVGAAGAHGVELVGTGDEHTLLHVAAVLDRHAVVPISVRTGSDTLEDAYLSLVTNLQEA